MSDSKEEKIGFKDKAKKVISENWEIMLGTLSIGALIGLIAFLRGKGYISEDLNDKLYDALVQKREDIRLNFRSKTWQSDLENIDNQLRNLKNPRRKLAESMTDEELSKHISSAWDIFEQAKRAFDKKREGLSYEQYRKDPEYINLNKLYDTFDQARIERDHRYAIANPDKFPIHREHGTNLYKE